ncbi:unnamed protein product [Darwinula stevensoni]|uniref:Peptidase S1 domain-containing protein n=1 Tax=Darwinula stevensoni TaxID=69355 RepID=A0A7R9A698_9CRUS|nr:unnamed protein product [Darwinula stevensoni]CAG0893824.1 unnamed protein product [Darwinula stevensoni]
MQAENRLIVGFSSFFTPALPLGSPDPPRMKQLSCLLLLLGLSRAQQDKIPTPLLGPQTPLLGSPSLLTGTPTPLLGPPQAADYGCALPFACVPFYLCSEGNIVTDGEGIIDVRFGPGKDSSGPPQLVGGNCPNFLDVCCRDPNAKPPPTPKPPPYVPRCGIRNNLGIDVRITFNASHDKHKYDHEAQYGEFPWMGVVLTAKPDAPEKDLYQCGASLVHPQVVLTAAHCVDKFAELFSRREFPAQNGLKVRLGEWDTTNDYEPYPHQDRFVEKVIMHSDYRKGPLYNDIALLFMNHPYDLSPHVDTICLPEPGYSRPWGNTCVSTGFGKNSFGKEGQYQVILKKVELPLVERIECEKRLQNTKLGQWFRLHWSFLCAGGVAGEDTCRGDGGGPLVCYDPNKGSWFQAGIVAWGIGCGNAIPGIYVDVAHFAPWIDEQITRYYHLSKPYWGFDLRQNAPGQGLPVPATNPAVPAPNPTVPAPIATVPALNPAVPASNPAVPASNPAVPAQVPQNPPPPPPQNPAAPNGPGADAGIGTL